MARASRSLLAQQGVDDLRQELEKFGKLLCLFIIFFVFLYAGSTLGWFTNPSELTKWGFGAALLVWCALVFATLFFDGR